MRVLGKPVRKMVVTGGAGFIGSNFIRYVHERFPAVEIVNFDKLTYAGNLENLRGIEGNYRFVRGDIRNSLPVAESIRGADAVINFAAETHVDRSIYEPGEFILTDVYGVFVLLESIRVSDGNPLFVHVSTDEVYGSIAEGAFSEESPLNPSSPYSASKAGGDRLCYSFFKTYGLPVIIVRPANNYGPFQYPEKLIPFFISRALAGEPLPLYGDGSNRRDWLHVRDTVRGLVALIERGEPGGVYNMGAGQERSNLEVSRAILALLGRPESQIRTVADRKGHDFRYAVNWDKLKGLGWRPGIGFEEGLKQTVEWYVKNREWWEKLIRKKDFQEHLKKSYE